MYLKSFSVAGYRSFANEVRLDDAGPVVVLFGLNNAGKSNLLRAVDFFGKLMNLPLARLVDGVSRNAEAFYAELAQDPWMFNLSSAPTIELHGIVAATAQSAHTTTVGFRVERMDDGSITARLTDWDGCDADSLLARAMDAHRAFRDAATSDLDLSSQASEQATDTWSKLQDTWARTLALLQPRLSVHRSAGKECADPTLRERFTRLMKTMDVPRRRRSVWALDRFASAVTGLPDGRLEPIENPPNYPNDFGWFSDCGVLPLDQLGSGAQAVFSVLAILALADIPMVGLEEPESHLNAQVQHRLAEALAGAIGGGSEISQIFIVTHSPAFAVATADVRLIERRQDKTTLTRETPQKMNAFAAAAGAGVDGKRTVSLLNYDGSVVLPDYVLDELKAFRGHFIYFVRMEPSGFRLVTEPEMARMLGEDLP